ncbi:MAG: hypothetical protein Q7J20_09795 [Candidatus Nitrotoga sp.]|nr:hypothetical protein [Candidatus Nitrotoga sp.]MDO9448164.1 hypothetical protein [Candidatus Nitrotoga sp.]MDP3496812.1 hypothetical protein [Candidatus Nitrotoga sp.]
MNKNKTTMQLKCIQSINFRNFHKLDVALLLSWARTGLEEQFAVRTAADLRSKFAWQRAAFWKR